MFSFKELASGKLSQWEWAGEDLKKSECDNVHGEVCTLYLKQWEEHFQDAQGKLEMFLFFSMREFRRLVSTMEHAESFGDQYVEQLKEFFCDEVKFTAQWEEGQGEEFSAPSLGDEEELKSQCTSYRRFVFRNFMGKNPEKELPWGTKDVLVSLLTKEIPTWLQPNTILYLFELNHFVPVIQGRN